MKTTRSASLSPILVKLEAMSASTLLTFYRMTEQISLWESAWKFLCFTPLFDSPKHDNAALIRSVPKIQKEH
nr:hypothetical protein [Tanacetum cinerariifolium]